MDKGTILILTSLAAGALGTGIGGALGALFAGAGEKTCGRVLAFAGGVMFGVVAFDMFPSAVSELAPIGAGGSAAAIGALVLGMAVVAALGKLVARISRGKSGKRENVKALQSGLAESGSGFWGAVSVFGNSKPKDRRGSMLKAGAVMLFAIALHNFPEGMAIGSAGSSDFASGIMLALVIAAHNVPEGIAIGAPMRGGGVSAVKAAGLACLAGLATVPGAAVGVLIGGISELASGLCVAFAGGAMLFVTLDDIIPECTRLCGRVPSAFIAVGTACAAAFVFLP